MKSQWAIKALVLGLLFSVSLSAQNFPKQPNPPRIVNDFANILNPDEEQRLENKLVAFDDSTSTQIAIVTLANLDGEPASSFAPALAENWGIGQKDRNNGLLILVSMDNPREVFIATGYGLEEYITDATAKRIIEEHVIPEFKRKNYFAGLDIATTDLQQLLQGTFKGFEKKGRRGNGGFGIPAWVILVFIILLVIFISRKSGGNAGGGRRYRTYGGPGWGGFPIGGGFGGGGFGGGGRSGGGFGGFGGGSFGGGGAGGSW